MCYASPGPRCHTHGKADYKKKQEAYDKAAQQAVKTGAPEDMQKAAKAEEAMNTARLDMNATKGGLKELSASAHSGDFKPFSTKYQATVKEYNEALAVYTEKMEAFDKENGTVDGRKPSTQWRQKDRNEIITELKAAHQAHNDYKREFAANKSKVGLEERQQKLDGLKKNVDTLSNRFEHSRQTAMHIRRDIIEAPKAEAKASTAKAATRPKDASKTKIKTAPRKTAASKSKAPHMPVEHKESGWGTYVGGKYDRNRTNQQVAAETRADLKQAVATGALPSEYKYKVSNRGNVITVAVIGDHSKHTNREYHGLSHYKREGVDFSNQVAAYPQQYAFDQSDISRDHFHSSHYIHVELMKEDGTRA